MERPLRRISVACRLFPRKGWLTARQISSYNLGVRRKRNALLPIEVSILQAGIDLHARRLPEFHGFLIAREIKEREGARLLTAYGTLYKALERMEKAGLLTSCWEDPMLAARDRRPRRRLYEVTPAGQKALAAASRVGTHHLPKLATELPRP